MTKAEEMRLQNLLQKREHEHLNSIESRAMIRLAAIKAKETEAKRKRFGHAGHLPEWNDDVRRHLLILHL